jgi:hypothetical protein
MLSIMVIGIGMNQAVNGQYYDYATGTYHATNTTVFHNVPAVNVTSEPATTAPTSQGESKSIQDLNDQNRYSAYSGIPFANCVETVNENTVVLHFVGSCSNDPGFENMKYYADFGYHVQNAKLITLGNMEVTLVKTGIPVTYNHLLSEMIDKLGICPSGLIC